MLIVLGSVSAITKATIVTDQTFSVTGHTYTQISWKRSLNQVSTSRHFGPLSGVVLFFVRKACIKATSVDIIKILSISPNTLSYKTHLLRYDLIEIRNTILLQFKLFY